MQKNLLYIWDCQNCGEENIPSGKRCPICGSI